MLKRKRCYLQGVVPSSICCCMLPGSCRNACFCLMTKQTQARWCARESTYCAVTPLNDIVQLATVVKAPSCEAATTEYSQTP